MVGVADQWVVAHFSRGFGLVSSSRLLCSGSTVLWCAIGGCALESSDNQLDGVTQCESIMCGHMCVVLYKTSSIAERSARCHGRQTIYPMVTVSAEMSDNPRVSLD
ncbi:hypothetical protein BO85DRAFT_445439, partial [Aspergillus piperis CBS 112811]